MIAENKVSGRQTRRAMVFALMVVFIDVIGFGLIIPVLPPLIEEVGQIGLSDAAQNAGWMFALFSLAQFACAPIMGALSDRFGRRPLLLLAVAGLAVDYVLHALAPSLLWLFVGRIIAGVCGSSYVIANACLADITPPENRARAFGLTSAAFAMGFVLGPALGGVLGAFGTRAPFWCAAALAGANFLFGLLMMPETLDRSKRRKFAWREANPLGVFGIFRQLPGVLPLVGVLSLYFFATAVYPAIWSFWGMAKFGWSTAVIGLTLAISGMAMALMQGVFAGRAAARWGEWRLAIAGLVTAMLCCAGFGLAGVTAVVIFLLVLHAIEGFVHPMLMALMSRGVPEDAQGALQGGVSALMSLAMLLGTLFFSSVFRWSLSSPALGRSPDTPFFLAALLFLFAALLLARQAVSQGKGGPKKPRAYNLNSR